MVNLRKPEQEFANIPSESTAQKPVPLPIIGIVNTEVCIKRRGCVISVETLHIVCAIEILIAWREISELDENKGTGKR
jgi:hypothetical protein